LAGIKVSNVQWFRGGLAFKAHRLLYRSTLDLRVIKRKKKYKGHSRVVYMAAVFVRMKVSR